MDKYSMRNSFLNIFIFDKPPMCGRTVDWGTRDLRQDVRFYCLVSSRMVLMWWGILGCFVIWAR